MELIGVIAAVAIIIIMTQRGFKLYWSILTGTIVVIVSNRFTLEEIFSITYHSLLSPTMITLTLIIISLTAFGNLMKETGSLKITTLTLSTLVKDYRYQMVILPLLIGLITFPGGAVFSAPLVEEAGKKLALSRERMVVANTAFRHVQYTIYPLYPGLLLIAEMTSYNLYDYILFNLPIFIIYFLFTFKYVFRGIKAKGLSGSVPENNNRQSDLLKLLYSLSPLILIILLVLIFDLYYPVAILIGILAVFFIYYPADRPFLETARFRLGHLVRGINWSMTFSIIAILLFKDFLEKSAVIENIMAVMLENNFPMLIPIIFLPFLAAFLMGNYFAAVGICVPLFIPILPPGEQGFYYMAMVFLASQAGYFGSPVHMCNILTIEHFKASLPPVIKDVNVLGATLILLGITAYLIRQYLL